MKFRTCECRWHTVQYLPLVVNFQALECEGAHDAIGHDKRHQYHMAEQTRAYLPGVMHQLGTSARNSHVVWILHNCALSYFNTSPLPSLLSLHLRENLPKTFPLS